MSYRSDATGEYLSRASTPAWGAWTICGWFRKNATAGGSFPTLFATLNASSYTWMGFNGANIQVWETTGGFSATILSPGDGNWFFAAMVHDGATTLRGYAALLGDPTLTGQTQSITMSSSTATGIRLLEDGGDADWFNGNAYGVKAWDAALTLAELEDELRQTNPMRTANLHLQVLLSTATDVSDTSGNGRDLTSHGSPSTEDSPNVPASVGSAPLFRGS